jgi:ABC-type phosphate transport system substrate-binding protein
MRTLTTILALLVSGAAAATGLSAQGRDFVVVVNAANPVNALTGDALSKLFLKKTARWGNGEDATPVDLSEGAAAREAFSQDVFHKSVDAIKSYWQSLIFSGRGVPPVELASDDAVLAYVRANSGAIGYVSAHAALGAGVRRVTLSN